MLGERAHCLAEAWRTLRQLHWCLAESARAWLSILPTIFMVNKDYQYSMVINFYSGLDKYQASTSNCWNCNRYGTTLCLKKIRTPIINMTYLHQFTTFSNYFLIERDAIQFFFEAVYYRFMQCLHGDADWSYTCPTSGYTSSCRFVEGVAWAELQVRQWKVENIKCINNNKVMNQMAGTNELSV